MLLVWVALAAIIVVGAVWLLSWQRPRAVTVFEYQRGLRYVRGRFRGVVGPGRYWTLARNTRIEVVDVRPGFVHVTGQEVLSSDGVPVKLSVVAKTELQDPKVATLEVQNYYEALHVALQLAIRDIVSRATVEELLQGRAGLKEQMMERSADRAAELGLKLHAVEVRDVMLPGDLKRIFAQVVEARQQGLASLEKARGETAALRSLANAARLVEGSPALIQLRVLQQLAASPGSSLILGAPGVLPDGIGAQASRRRRTSPSRRRDE